MKKRYLASMSAAFIVALYVSLYYVRNQRVELRGVSRAEAVENCSALDKFLATDASNVFVTGPVRAYSFFGKYRTSADRFRQWAADRPLEYFSEPRQFKNVYDVQSSSEELEAITVYRGMVSEYDVGAYHSLAVYDDDAGMCYIGMWASR